MTNDNHEKFKIVSKILDEYYRQRESDARELGYAGKVDEVLVILGYKPDPKYRDFYEAIRDGWSPKTLDAAELIRIHGVIDAVINTLVQLVPQIKTEVGKLGVNLPKNWRDSMGVPKIFVKVLSGKYTGSWFPQDKIPAGWIGLDKYDSAFKRKISIIGRLFHKTEFLIFSIPRPIDSIIASLFQDKIQ